MPDVKAILVDDERPGLQTLELLLKKHCPEVSIAATFTEPKKALKELSKIQPDILFLDIEMPEMTGFDFLDKAKTFDGHVIFVTAHSGYALRAFKFSALDYLLKPVEPDELIQAVKKALKLKGNKPDNPHLQLMTKNLEFLAHPSPKRIAVSTSESVEVVILDEVTFMKADRNYTIIKRSGKKDLITAKPLKDFEESLANTQFMRIHSAYLVNMDKVSRFVRKDGGYAEMNDGTQLGVSRSNRDEFLNRLKA